MPRNKPKVDHRAKAAYWGSEALLAIQTAIGLQGDAAHFDELHAVRAARLAFWHAAQAKGYRYWDDRWVGAQCKS